MRGMTNYDLILCLTGDTGLFCYVRLTINILKLDKHGETNCK